MRVGFLCLDTVCGRGGYYQSGSLTRAYTGDVQQNKIHDILLEEKSIIEEDMSMVHGMQKVSVMQNLVARED